MSASWYWPDWGTDPEVAVCSDPPAESCSDAGCPIHGDDTRDDPPEYDPEAEARHEGLYQPAPPDPDSRWA